MTKTQLSLRVTVWSGRVKNLATLWLLVMYLLFVLSCNCNHLKTWEPVSLLFEMCFFFLFVCKRDLPRSTYIFSIFCTLTRPPLHVRKTCEPVIRIIMSVESLLNEEAITIILTDQRSLNKSSLSQFHCWKFTRVSVCFTTSIWHWCRCVLPLT